MRCIACDAPAYGWFCNECQAVKETSYREACEQGLATHAEVIAKRDRDLDRAVRERHGG